jgi:hypothetical protein
MAIPPTAATMLVDGEAYRVAATRWDPVLNQHWVVISSCDHPDHPAISISLKATRQATSSQQGRETAPSQSSVIHAGDLVQLWSQEQNLRLEIAGRAEQNGAVGSRIRVRLLHSGFDTGQEQTMVGIVRGPRNVEIRP